MFLRFANKIGLGNFSFSNLRLKIDRENKAVFLTLTNPNKRNSLSLQTVRKIYQSLQEVNRLRSSQKLKILILRGQGLVFSAGHDLKQLKDAERPQQIFRQCNKMMIALKTLPMITLCAADNIVAAAGLQLALTCDLILATKKASFGIPGIKRGLFPSTPLVQLERSLKSRSIVKEIVCFGQMLTAEQVFKIGLVNKIVEEEDFEKEISSYILKANKLSGQVLAHGKSVLNKQVNLDLQQAYKVAIEGMRANILQLQDCGQGLDAFASKRVPQFKK